MAVKKLIFEDWMLVKRLTKKQLGEKMGYNYSYVSQITSARVIPKKFGKKFVEVFGEDEAKGIVEFADFLKTIKE